MRKRGMAIYNCPIREQRKKHSAAHASAKTVDYACPFTTSLFLPYDSFVNLLVSLGGSSLVFPNNVTVTFRRLLHSSTPILLYHIGRLSSPHDLISWLYRHCAEILGLIASQSHHLTADLPLLFMLLLLYTTLTKPSAATDYIFSFNVRSSILNWDHTDWSSSESSSFDVLTN